MSTNYIFAIFLILLAITLFVAVNKKMISYKKVTDLANISGIAALLLSVFLFVFPFSSQEPNSERPDNGPRVHVVNNLELPITITIEGESRGRISAHQAKTYFITSFPATVEWAAVNMQTSRGTKIGEPLGGVFNAVNNNSTIQIDHKLGSAIYFFPKVTNNTDVACSFSFGPELLAVGQSRISIKPHTISGLGYYKLNDDMDLYFHCEGSDLPYFIRWKADSDAIPITGDLMGEVEPPSGILKLLIND